VIDAPEAIDVVAVDVIDSAPPDDAIDASPGRKISWTVERAGGATGCDGVALIAVSYGDVDSAVRLPDCAAGSIDVELPAATEQVVLKALSPTFVVLGSARLRVEGTGDLTGKILITGEPLAQLQELRAGITAYFDEHNELPPSRPMTPSMPCCQSTGDLCEAKAEDWTPFAVVKFDMTEPFRFQYGYRKLTADSVRISAIADYDCDAHQNVVFVDGRITTAGFLEWDPPAVMDSE
jgi:hypothetical protein